MLNAKVEKREKKLGCKFIAGMSTRTNKLCERDK
jgi:hypothetical protein